MSNQSMTILVTGATGSIGSLVVDEALRQGHSVHALVRSPEKARRLPAKAESVIGDLTRPDTLAAAVKDIDAIIFTHGSDGAGKAGSETVDYGASIHLNQTPAETEDSAVTSVRYQVLDIKAMNAFRAKHSQH